VPVFIIDTYTRRVLASEKLATKETTYDALQELFHTALPSSQEGAVALYQEYHALIVEHAKRLPRK